METTESATFVTNYERFWKGLGIEDLKYEVLSVKAF